MVSAAKRLFHVAERESLQAMDVALLSVVVDPRLGNREGFLGLLTEPSEAMPLREAGIDWSKTTAWGEGGYYSRIFLNVAGREPEGTIPAEDYERVRDDLAERLAAIPDENGEPLATRVHVPERVYPEV